MAIIPITLEGNNLGKRHKQLNFLVNDAFKNNVLFDSVRDIPEKSAIDRLFKIDLAAKYRNVDYILKSFKDEDMLYVSRAMKCTWLVKDDQYIDVINPVNLEQNLYQEMRINAANKMKHWIQLNIKNETRSKEFYEYYKKDEVDYAIKFLTKCSTGFLLQEMELIPVDNIKPQFLKMLCERSTKAAEIYFKKLMKNDGFVSEDFISKMQFLRKSDPDTYFYVMEHFFLADFKRLNKEATQYIMENHRDRFEAKPELYTRRILNVCETAKYLNSEIAQNLITKLARARYFDENRIDYEFAKPLLKIIDPKLRSEFGTKIFKEKKFGEPLEESPYFIKSRVLRDSIEDKIYTLDREDDNYNAALEDPPPMQLCCARSGGRGFRCPTELDIIYDEYRFKSFEKTFIELKKRIPKESRIGMRQNMMLVLVSKTGGRSESVEALLEYLLEKHSNEPINMRAAIVRSFVKRAFAWRWSEPNWKMLLRFGHDLGLEGSTSEVPCDEGLHAIILRHMFLNGECPSAVFDKFLSNFTPLNEYKLNSSERHILHQQLPVLLLSAANNESQSSEVYFKRLNYVCNALDAYKLKIGTYPDILQAIAEFASKYVSLAKPLMLKLFKSRTGRKLLFISNFEIIKTDAMYVNVLRHDSSLLTDKKFEDLLANINDLHHDQFLRKLALYFSEEGGLAARYMEILKKKARDQPHVKLARPMALLTGAHAITWPTLEKPKNDLQLRRFQQMVESLQMNSHLARERSPPLLGSKDVNLAALANWIHTCSPKALQRGLESLVVYPRHARLTLALHGTTVPGLVAKTLPHAARSRPKRTLQITLRILRRSPQVFLPQDFEALKSLVSTIKFKGYCFKSYCKLVQLDHIPKSFRAEYALLLYQSLDKLGFGPERNSKSKPYYRIAVPLIMCINNHVDELDPSIVKTIIKQFLDKVFTKENIEKFGNDETKYHQKGFFDFREYVKMFMKLIARFLITSKTDEDIKDRMLEIYVPFEQRVKELWQIEEVSENSTYSYGYFENFLESALCSRVFVNEADFSLVVLNQLCSFGDEVAPMMQNVGTNYRIRFIRLFRQAVKLSVENQPGLFKSGRVEGKEAISLIFFTFGEIAAEDVETLISIYFPSLRMFYMNALMLFLKAHKLPDYDSSIRGLLNDESKVNAIVIGMSFYNSKYKEYSGDRKNEDIEQRIGYLMKNSKSNEIKFYHEFSELSFNIGRNSMI